MDNRKFNKLTTILAICAIAISIASFIISYNSCNISKDDLDLKIEPKIRAAFTQLDSINVKLVIYNDGSRTIRNIGITQILRIMQMGDNIATKKLNDTELDKLDDGDSIAVNLKYEDMKKVFNLTSEIDPNIKSEDCDFYIGIFIKYTCKPDNSEYKLSKYILLWKNQDGSFIPADLDSPNYNKFHGQNYKSEFEKTDSYYAN